MLAGNWEDEPDGGTLGRATVEVTRPHFWARRRGARAHGLRLRIGPTRWGSVAVIPFLL